MFDDCRSRPRRRVYLGEGLTFDIGARAEAVDLTCEGLGLAIVQPLAALPAVGDAVAVRYTGPGASGETQEAVVRHVGSVRGLPRVGLSLVHDAPAEPRFALFSLSHAMSSVNVLAGSDFLPTMS